MLTPEDRLRPILYDQEHEAPEWGLSWKMAEVLGSLLAAAMQDAVTEAEAPLRAHIKKLEEREQIAIGALADIAFSRDMTLSIIQKKAARIYQQLRAKELKAEKP